MSTLTPAEVSEMYRLIRQLRTEHIPALKADLAAAQQDANRYRWLRARMTKTHIVDISMERDYGVEEWRSNIDDAVDIAMARGES